MPFRDYSFLRQVLAGEQLCPSAHPQDMNYCFLCLFVAVFPAHCLPLELHPIRLLARQESDYEMETLVDSSRRFSANELP